MRFYWPLGVDIVCLFPLSDLTTLFLITSRRFYYDPAPAAPLLAACAMTLLALSLSTSELFRIYTVGFVPSDELLLAYICSTFASSFSHRDSNLPFSILILSSSSRFSLSEFSSSLTSVSCSVFTLSISCSNSFCLAWHCF